MRAATPPAGPACPAGAHAAPALAAPETQQATPRQRAWALLRRVAPWLLALLVLGLVVNRARGIDWPAVWQALLAQPRGGLAAAAALALLSYALFAAYDLVGRRVTGHRLPRRRVLGIAAICYAFNLNFGALVGALALKLRLYARAGLDTATTLRVIGLSVLGNWLGYLALGGAVLLLAPPPLPADWPLPAAALRAVGATMLLAAGAYLLLCARGPRGGRRLAWRSHALTLPGGRTAGAQVALSAANWALMGAIVWLLLGRQLDYATVLGVLLMAAVAGVVTHVPAGLGVIEAVFLTCLQGQVAEGPLLAALLAYRASYYLLPLALAGLGYLLFERRGAGGQGGPPDG